MTAIIQFTVEGSEVAGGAQATQPLVNHTHCRFRVEVVVWIRQLNNVMVA